MPSPHADFYINLQRYLAPHYKSQPGQGEPARRAAATLGPSLWVMDLGWRRQAAKLVKVAEVILTPDRLSEILDLISHLWT